MLLERHLLCEVATVHGLEEPRERLGADRVRGDDLVLGADRHVLGDEAQERDGVDDVAGHESHPNHGPWSRIVRSCR